MNQENFQDKLNKALDDAFESLSRLSDEDLKRQLDLHADGDIAQALMNVEFVDDFSIDQFIADADVDAECWSNEIVKSGITIGVGPSFVPDQPVTLPPIHSSTLGDISVSDTRIQRAASVTVPVTVPSESNYQQFVMLQEDDLYKMAQAA